MSSDNPYPKKCECGGTLVYTRGVGQVHCYCKKCTPVVKMKVSRGSNGYVIEDCINELKGRRK